MSRVFVTGATGFIGRAFVRAAADDDFELLCLARHPESADRASPAEGVRFVAGDLASIPWAEIERFEPDSLLHLAWIATPGEYLRSPANDVLVEQSAALIEGLIDRGLSYVAGVGSCIEYAPSSAPLREATSPTLADSPYASAKGRLHDWLAERTRSTDAAWSWLRVFHPYGPGEHPGRITTSFIRTLCAGEPVSLRTPDSIKDFVYIDDLARAVCGVLKSRLAGDVNIGTGQGTSIHRIAELCADAVGAPRDRVQVASEPAHDPRPVVVADATKLGAIGWRPDTSLEVGLARLVDSIEGASSGR